MKCTGCFKKLNEEEKAYATFVGSIEEFDYEDVGLGFCPDEIETLIIVLCEKCGIEIHKFIAEQLQAKHL